LRQISISRSAFWRDYRENCAVRWTPVQSDTHRRGILASSVGEHAPVSRRRYVGQTTAVRIDPEHPKLILQSFRGDRDKRQLALRAQAILDIYIVRPIQIVIVCRVAPSRPKITTAHSGAFT
jgi:hypothetical protein